MLKFAIRRNLIFPLQLLIWNTIRDIDIFLVKYFFDYNEPGFYAFLMSLGQFLAGLIFYLYYKKMLTKPSKVKSAFVYNLGIIRTKKEAVIDSKIKIGFLLYFASFLDILMLAMFSKYSKINIISSSLEQRLRGIFTIYIAIFYYYLLKFPIYKHQIFSLIIIGICLLIIISTEIIFIEFDIFFSFKEYIFVIFVSFFMIFIGSLCETIEKYLIEFDQLSPFFIIMMEGIFGIIISFMYNIYNKSFHKINKFNKKLSTLEFAMLICSFILFIFLSGGKGLFKLATIKIYSPIVSTFMIFIINPIYLIIFFLLGNDFIYKGKRDYIYFILNLIISLIISFCGCVYNEFIILFCCGLERDTHNQVVLRADSEKNIGPLINDEDSENFEENEKEDGQEEEDELFKLISLQSLNKK